MQNNVAVWWPLVSKPLSQCVLCMSLQGLLLLLSLLLCPGARLCAQTPVPHSPAVGFCWAQLMRTAAGRSRKGDIFPSSCFLLRGWGKLCPSTEHFSPFPGPRATLSPLQAEGAAGSHSAGSNTPQALWLSPHPAQTLVFLSTVLLLDSPQHPICVCRSLSRLADKAA